MNTKSLSKQEFAMILGMSLRTFQRRIYELNIKLPRGLLSPTLQEFIQQKLEELELKKLANLQNFGVA